MYKRQVQTWLLHIRVPTAVCIILSWFPYAPNTIPSEVKFLFCTHTHTRGENFLYYTFVPWRQLCVFHVLLPCKLGNISELYAVFYWNSKRLPWLSIINVIKYSLFKRRIFLVDSEWLHAQWTWKNIQCTDCVSFPSCWGAIAENWHWPPVAWPSYFTTSTAEDFHRHNPSICGDNILSHFSSAAFWSFALHVSYKSSFCFSPIIHTDNVTTHCMLGTHSMGCLLYTSRCV